MNSIGYARYKATSLKKISHKKIKVVKNHKISIEPILVDYKIFNKKDCKKYLNSKDILKKGYQPIQIIVTNNSKHDISISIDDFSFPCISAHEVANELHRNGATRGAGFGAGAFFCPILLIPACVQGCGANQFNNDMDRDFVKKSLKDQVVLVNKTANGIIFIEEDDFTQDFTLTVQDQVTKKSLILIPQEIKKII